MYNSLVIVVVYVVHTYIYNYIITLNNYQFIFKRLNLENINVSEIIILPVMAIIYYIR